MIRVAVADDHHLVRQGICSLLKQSADIVVIGEAANGKEAVELVEKEKPDVLVLDLSMERMNGIQATEQIRRLPLNTYIVMLSMHADTHLVQQALRAGVNGYLVKNSITEELLLAIRAASRGQTYLSPEISQALVSNFVSGGQENLSITTALENLTSREREVFKLIAEGNTNNDIADLLQISLRTVQKHRTNLMEKLDVHNIAGLTRLAIKYGLIHIE